MVSLRELRPGVCLTVDNPGPGPFDRGRMWAGTTSAPIEAGCCVFLPKGQLHCVENTGTSELRLLGVFHPAGSPAVRYDAESAAG